MTGNGAVLGRRPAASAGPAEGFATAKAKSGLCCWGNHFLIQAGPKFTFYWPLATVDSAQAVHVGLECPLIVRRWRPPLGLPCPG